MTNETEAAKFNAPNGQILGFSLMMKKAKQ